MLERRGGEGVDELLEMVVIVEREEMKRVKREDAWGPGYPNSRTANASLPSTPIPHASSTTITPTTSSMRQPLSLPVLVDPPAVGIWMVFVCPGLTMFQT